ncbi:UDP-N-acetylmuramoyl-tripeptide--D-alanyl-D-alanine ligase [Candidatus Cyanaurora vandensis]|uniref:UDP-N-acetylmuramoyl-tripeptide--D-alanyl-D- alanine ligase n=1 Tax=Candidatus Cyanaurora vandensis TaxID=2714958 RepID=UPI00258034F4|nr:UDP-N-acetylmuramoyl-tripeptide--D-alanyl-D-alanine ligase [Candidatus Cyanaurora vandensis]
MRISFAALIACVGGQWSGGVAPGELVGVSTDTRTLQPGELFVPLIGERYDGHDYLGLALERGAGCVLSARPTDLPHLRVSDTLGAYQQLARWWREHFQGPVIGVTGSAGKTTTKELIAQVLGPFILKTPANENNDIGVARTLLSLEPTHRAVVVEMAMRGPGEILRLAQTARPTVGVITNVGLAHVGRLGSPQAIARAKCELLIGLEPDGIAVLNGEDELLLQTAAEVWSGKTLTYGFTENTYLAGELHHRGLTFTLPLPGRHQALNFLAALTVAEALGYKLADLSSLPALVLPGGRLRILTLPQGITLVDETYNAAPEAVLACLDWLAEYQGGRRLAVLGMMGELGDFALPLHRTMGERVRDLRLDGLFLYGNGPEITALAQAAYPVPSQVHAELATLAYAITKDLQPDDRVLFKASRAVALERIFPLLAKLPLQELGAERV